MSKWNIDPAGVQTVINDTQEQQQDLGDALKESAFESIFTGVSSGAPFTNEVPNALNNLLNDQQANLSNIVNRVGAGVLGVANATLAYNNGQLDMAGEFNGQIQQASAGDFSFFEQHGYQGE